MEQNSAGAPGNDGYSGSAFGFENLAAYRAGVVLRRRAYVIIRALPAEEKFALGVQMRKAAVSITNNIAEGHGRHHCQENMQFCRISRGSLMELVDDLSVCVDEGYITQDVYKECRGMAADFLRILNGYIRYLKTQKPE